MREVVVRDMQRRGIVKQLVERSFLLWCWVAPSTGGRTRTVDQKATAQGWYELYDNNLVSRRVSG